MASRKKKVAQTLKNPMLPFEPLSRDKPMPVTARRERPPKPLGSTCGAGVRGGRGGSEEAHSAGPEQDMRAQGGGQEGQGPAGTTWGQGWVLVA